MTALAIKDSIDIPQVVQRYLGGESIVKIASELGVHRQRIYEWMLAGVGDKHYHDTVTQVLVRRVADADEALECPDVEPDTARARARADLARRDLERRRPALYGQKQEITHVAPSGPLFAIAVVSMPNAVPHNEEKLVVDSDK